MCFLLLPPVLQWWDVISVIPHGAGLVINSKNFKKEKPFSYFFFENLRVSTDSPRCGISQTHSCGVHGPLPLLKARKRGGMEGRSRGVAPRTRLQLDGQPPRPPPPLSSPLGGDKWPGLAFAANAVFSKMSPFCWRLAYAFIVLLNSAYVELLLFSVLYITSSSRSIRVSLSAGAAHRGFLTDRSWKIRMWLGGLPKGAPREAPSWNAGPENLKPTPKVLVRHLGPLRNSKTVSQTLKRTRPTSHGMVLS